MKIVELIINDCQIWLVIEQHNKFSSDFKTDKFLCYFKLTEPNLLFYGELFKDEMGNPILFNSEIEAEEYAKNFLCKRKPNGG